MINKYFLVIDNDDTVLGIKKYRGVADLPVDKCFSDAKPNTRTIQVKDREYFKMFNFTDLADMGLLREVDNHHQYSMAKWNSITQEIEFTYIIKCEVVDTTRQETFSSIFAGENKNLYIQTLASGTSHKINLSICSVEQNKEIPNLSTKVTVNVLSGSLDTMTPQEDVTTTLVNGKGCITLPIPTSPSLMICRVTHESFLVANSLIYFKYI